MHPADSWFSLLQIHFCFMLSSLLKQPHITSFVGFFLHVVFGSLGFMMFFEEVPPSLEWVFNLFSPYTFTAGISKVCSKQSHCIGMFSLQHTQLLPSGVASAICDVHLCSDAVVPLHSKCFAGRKCDSKKVDVSYWSEPQQGFY